MATIQVTTLGRIVTIFPAEVGAIFENSMVVTRIIPVPASADNGWKRGRIASPENTFWYDKDKDGRRLFCAFGGYTESIYATLDAKGLAYDRVQGRPHGLPDPDIHAIKSTQWRPGQLDTVLSILSYNSGLIICPTAFGKTFIIRQLCRVYQGAKIVIVVSSLDIARAVYDELRFNLPNVGFCGTGNQHPDRITVCVAASMHNAAADASLVLVDECHTICTPDKIKNLNRFYRAKMFGFTATPTGRSDGADGYLQALFGKTLVDVGYAEAVSTGNVVQLEAHIIPITQGTSMPKDTDSLMVDRVGIIRHAYRNQQIVKAAHWLEEKLGPDLQILIMVDKVEHAYILGQQLPDYTIVTGTVAADRHSELLSLRAKTPEQKLCSPKDRDHYRKQFEQNILKRVIATRVWEKGVDFRDLAGLIRADGLASSIAAGQIPGRLSRLGKETDKKIGILVDCNDKFTPQLEGRSRKRIREYRANGWPIHALYLS